MDRLSFLTHYLQYIRSRTNEHGVHSPFIFSLYNEVFKKKPQYYRYSDITSLRTRMESDSRILTVDDMGAGSTYTNKGVRSVRSIARTAAKAPKYTELLFRLTDYFQPETIIE